jgi:membrane protein involved in D-alanine export
MTRELFVSLLTYVVVSRLVLDLTRGYWRDFLFALINIIAFMWLAQTQGHHWDRYALSYVGFALFIFVLSHSRSNANILALWLPIAVLVSTKFLLPAAGWKPLEWAGISYMMFRLVLFGFEVRSGAIVAPGFCRFLAYCFYLPTAFVGPISPFHLFTKLESRKRLSTDDLLEGIGRIVFGYFQYRVVAPILNRVSFHGHWMDGNEYGIGFFVVSCSASFLYLYFNFCGFCDIAMGTSRLLGVPVMENFDRPFLAVNVKEFWNRWHISLSSFMRDLVFTPLSKFLTRWWGPSNVSHAVAATIFVVFTLIGIWHGASVNYLLFGLMHGAGVVWNHYQAIWLKKKLGKKYKSYTTDWRVRWTSRGLTFLYVSLSFFLFENDLTSIQSILSRLRLFWL